MPIFLEKWPFLQFFQILEKLFFAKNTQIKMVQGGAHMCPYFFIFCYFYSTQRERQNDALFDTFRQIWPPLRYTLFKKIFFLNPKKVTK